MECEDAAVRAVAHEGCERERAEERADGGEERAAVLGADLVGEAAEAHLLEQVQQRRRVPPLDAGGEAGGAASRTCARATALTLAIALRSPSTTSGSSTPSARTGSAITVCSEISHSSRRASTPWRASAVAIQPGSAASST